MAVLFQSVTDREGGAGRFLKIVNNSIMIEELVPQTGHIHTV